MVVVLLVVLVHDLAVNQVGLVELVKHTEQGRMTDIEDLALFH